ncbi:MAG: YdcF family protein [Luteimonas sp.]
MLLDILIRLVVILAYPPVLSLCLMAGGALAAVKGRRGIGMVLCTSAIGWTLLLSIPFVSEALRRPLEVQEPDAVPAPSVKSDAIVVLGGGVVSPMASQPSRLATAAQAWRAGRAPIVILSGGGGRNGTGRGRSEAEGMARAITRLGVPESALLLETRSRSTEGNALETAALATPRGIHRILLVTSALHMPRATLEFKEAGFEVSPLAEMRRPPLLGWRERWWPSTRALWRSGRALKEYLALLAVQVHIPAPAALRTNA